MYSDIADDRRGFNWQHILYLNIYILQLERKQEASDWLPGVKNICETEMNEPLKMESISSPQGSEWTAKERSRRAFTCDTPTNYDHEIQKKK